MTKNHTFPLTKAGNAIDASAQTKKLKYARTMTQYLCASSRNVCHTICVSSRDAIVLIPVQAMVQRSFKQLKRDQTMYSGTVSKYFSWIIYYLCLLWLSKALVTTKASHKLKPTFHKINDQNQHPPPTNKKNAAGVLNCTPRLHLEKCTQWSHYISWSNGWCPSSAGWICDWHDPGAEFGKHITS